MKQRFAYNILSVFLGLLILFGSTAKEFIHQFADHEDTVHCNNLHKGELSFESEHHHCSFLGDSLAPFHADAQFPYVALISFDYHLSPNHFIFSFLTKERFFTSLRGPPTAFI